MTDRAIQEALLAVGCTEIEPVAAGGRTPAKFYRAKFSDGQPAFVKVATDGNSTAWLSTEIAMYSEGLQDVAPRLLTCSERPIALLVIEDLSAATWPPPWTQANIEAVVALLDRVAAAPVPPALPPLAQRCGTLGQWTSVAQDPEPLLRLQLCDREWLHRALPWFIGAARTAPLAGDELVHFDVRSDNLCVRDNGSACLVDWNWACRGNREIDLVAWLPSLHSEGGPPPSSVHPDATPELVAIVAGHWAAEAGRPPIALAPGLRELQRSQLVVALPWLAERLDLPLP